MTVKVVDHACPENSGTDNHKSAENPGDSSSMRRGFAEQLVKGLFLEFDDDEIVNLVIDAFAGRTSQHKKQLEIASFAGVDKETVRRWIAGDSKPISRGFAMICLVAMLQALPVSEQRAFLNRMLGVDL